MQKQSRGMGELLNLHRYFPFAEYSMYFVGVECRSRPLASERRKRRRDPSRSAPLEKIRICCGAMSWFFFFFPTGWRSKWCGDSLLNRGIQNGETQRFTSLGKFLPFIWNRNSRNNFTVPATRERERERPRTAGVWKYRLQMTFSLLAHLMRSIKYLGSKTIRSFEY